LNLVPGRRSFLRPEILSQVQTLETEDIVVGLTSFNNAAIIRHVVRAVEVGLQPGPAVAAGSPCAGLAACGDGRRAIARGVFAWGGLAIGFYRGHSLRGS
jgi:hypothetical protein